MGLLTLDNRRRQVLPGAWLLLKAHVNNMPACYDASPYIQVRINTRAYIFIHSNLYISKLLFVFLLIDIYATTCIGYKDAKLLPIYASPVSFSFFS